MYNESILRYNFIRLEKFVAPPAEPVEAAEPVSEEPEAEKTEDAGEAETVVEEPAAATEE